MRTTQRSRAIGIRRVVIKIVQQDQIEIGGCGHLAAAQPAHRQNRGLLLLDAAVLGGERIRHQAVHGIDDAFGDIGKRNAGLRGRHRTGEDARADQEQALLAEQAQSIEEFLVGIGVRQGRRETRR